MKKSFCLILAVMLLALGFSACSGAKEPFDALDAYQRLISEVKFDSQLHDASDYAGFVFGDVAEGASVSMAMADGKLEDAVIYIKLADEADVEKAVAAVKDYISQRRTEAERYEPDEVPKLDKAVVFTKGADVLVCITNDTATANSILK